MRLSTALALALSAVCCVPVPTFADPLLRFRAAFTSVAPGEQTTAEFTIEIESPDGAIPPPLVEVQVRYPAGLGIELSGLGVQTCSRAVLEAGGAKACPAGAVMGKGSVTAEIQFGPEPIIEPASVVLVRAPQNEGNLALLLSVAGERPVSAEPILDGLLEEAPLPYGGILKMGVPLIEGFPGGADVSVTRMELKIGPRGLVYYERVDGQFVAYHPRGLRVPERCPSGGYPFALALQFQGNEQANARSLVPCRKYTRAKRPHRE